MAWERDDNNLYTYDALGRRTSKSVDDAVAMTTETTVFVSLTQPISFSEWAGQVLAEYTSGTAASAPLRKYAYGDYIDEPLVLVDRTAAGSTGSGTDEAFYYHRNQQYSIAALSDSGGSISERYHYTPNGNTTITAVNGTTVRAASDVGNAYTYTGRRLMSEVTNDSLTTSIEQLIGFGRCWSQLCHRKRYVPDSGPIVWNRLYHSSPLWSRRVT